MYANTGSIDDAGIGIFFGEIYRDVVYWNILISSYISREDVEVAKCFNKMQGEVRPSIVTLTLVILASAKNRKLLQGEKTLHCFAIKSGLYDTVLQTSLLDFYAKCGDLERPAQMFRESPFRTALLGVL